MERNRVLHLLIWGVGGCGRRSIIYRSIHNSFISDYDPVGEDSWRKNITVDDTQTVVDLAFNPGYPDNAAFLTQYIRRCDGAMFAYASNDRQSFEEIRNFHELFCTIKERNDFPAVLVETKADLPNERQIRIEDGQQLAKELNAPFFSTSAKNSINVNEAIQKLTEITYRDLNTIRTIDNKGKVVLRIPPYKDKIEKFPSTMREDIQKHLFNNPEYSDLTIVAITLLFTCTPILVSRWPSFMERIKPIDESIELGPEYTHRAMLDLLQYVYTGHFRGVIDKDLKFAVIKWQVYTLMPLFKEGHVDDFDPQFTHMYNLEFMSDVKVVLKSHNDRTLFAHRAVLCARSEYFRILYQAGFKESNSAVLEVEDCDYDTFLLMLSYYYLDRINITQNNFIPLLRISHRYNERAVLRAIEAFLQDHLTIKNVGYVIKLAEVFNLIDLQSVCEHFIVHRFDAVAKTSGFKRLSQQTKDALQAKKKPGQYEVEKDTEDLLIKRLKLFKI